MIVRYSQSIFKSWTVIYWVNYPCMQCEKKIRAALFEYDDQFLQQKYTMLGFEWKDRRGVDFETKSRNLPSMTSRRLPTAFHFLTAFSENLHDYTRSKAVSFFEIWCTKIHDPYALPTDMRRQALTPLSFSNGPNISIGDWVCVPHVSMMRDSHYYQNTLESNAFRFINKASAGSPKPFKLTDTSQDWLIWRVGYNWYCIFTQIWLP